ncbi:hypothetical protein AGLY_017857 [Aphis glycines]|uniref:Uncharacterized protein n=1 Tax=Aphis glycines TaxID=307491 RepID=A0A6G0STP0_APHGL|nr:hypothetical protein AGLY_017857 [Aphis glycines]
MKPAPLFLTNKLSVRPLEYRVYDFQLRDHFMSVENIYVRKCACTNHTHNRKHCVLSNDPACKKCNRPFELLVRYPSLMFHAKELRTCRLFECCTHVHYPPCQRCVGCKTGGACVVTEPYDCKVTTDTVCWGPKQGGAAHSTTLVEHDLSDHLYATRVAQFYFCKTHAHTHDISTDPAALSTATTSIPPRSDTSPRHQPPCYVQTCRCCNDAVHVTAFDKSFAMVSGNKEYVIYDPSLWREQSTNHFASLVRAFVSVPQAISDRYKRFESSNFKVSNIKRYKSGKQSVVRTAITGFETRGIYQTATISCELPQNVVVLPQRIWDLMVDDYDLSLVCVKRDPCIKPTCMFVCRAVRNADPGIDVVIINDSIAKPMNQDQDGDKNAVYALPRHPRDHYDRCESFLHKLSKFEMARAYGQTQTLIALPRYSFSENSRMLMYRNAEWLKTNSEFFRRTHGHGLDYMIDAGCGYLTREYHEFCEQLRYLNATNNSYCVTLDDYLRRTDTIPSIVASGAKGHVETMDMFFDKLNDRSTRLSATQVESSIEQMNRYISSGQKIRHSGREQFVLVYCEGELKSMFGSLFLNTKPYADLKPFFSAFTFMFNEASLMECVKDLISTEIL